MRRTKTLTCNLSRFATAVALGLALAAGPLGSELALAADVAAKTKTPTQKTQKAAAAKPAAKAEPEKVAALQAKPVPATKKIVHAERPMLRPTGGFIHAGRFVRVEAFHAQGEGLLPAVIILHGASGMGDGTLFYPQAQALTERGISAFVVHYFDGLPNRRGAAAPNLHDQREKIVTAALNYVEAMPYVDGTKIGMFGLSLGGFQALALASKDERVQAVVDVIGAMPAQVAREGVMRMPPTLILHGDRDRTVPFKRAQELQQILENLGTPYEMKIYHGETHNFRVAAREDSIRETVDFFERHLKAPS